MIRWPTQGLPGGKLCVSSGFGLQQNRAGTPKEADKLDPAASGTSKRGEFERGSQCKRDQTPQEDRGRLLIVPSLSLVTLSI